MGLEQLTIKEASEKLAKGEITSVELTEAVLARIDEIDPKVGSFITVTNNLALEKARESDARRRSGETKGNLDGIPVAVKDCFLTKGIKTTSGSRILEDFIPVYESTVTRKLWEAGAVLIGKTNLDEFTMGSSTETSAYNTSTEFNSPTRNPWDLGRVPGGSSGGSAAAVAADECIAAVGTDTGGSIRQPAGLCGVTGIRASYGRVSRFGSTAMASSLDQAGSFGKTVEDAAIMLEAISGHDKYDSTSSEKTVPKYSDLLEDKAKGWKIGIPEEFYGEGMDVDVEAKIRAAADKFVKMGAKLVPVSLPIIKYALASYYILMPAEVSSNMARYDGIRFGYSKLKGDRSEAETLMDIYLKSRAEGFGAEVKRRIMLGSYVLSAGYYDAYYKKAQRVRTLIKKEFDKVFESVDFLLTPVSPTPAFKFGEKTTDPLSMYMADINTVPVNIAGLPGISLPAGFVERDDKDLPVGMQLIGPMWGEETLLRAGHVFQLETDWHLRKPQI
ncbi:MAG: Asp-tRNA(Asn)/Glu-tRNA(Gln) amidotransferase subunit GatA [Patescibacteria group bacterium]|jgi:aspartyl-tRNA(Asn)/glutamyl-tRNA(Gln) amidotransferase subunit A